MSKGLFVIGTGTDVGKTYISALLVKTLRRAGVSAGYYKAAVSGNRRVGGKLIPEDAAYVKKEAGLVAPLDQMASYVYEAAVSPHLAARWEGRPVERSVVRRDFEAACRRYDYVTVEGSGGIVCPIRMDTQRIFLTDLIEEFRLPTLLVASAALGGINSAVLTVEYARQRGIAVKGIILNHFRNDSPMEQDNLHLIAQLTGCPVLATVERGASALDLELDCLTSLYE